jgi:hypothetical protein
MEGHKIWWFRAEFLSKKDSLRPKRGSFLGRGAGFSSFFNLETFFEIGIVRIAIRVFNRSREFSVVEEAHFGFGIADFGFADVKLLPWTLLRERTMYDHLVKAHRVEFDPAMGHWAWFVGRPAFGPLRKNVKKLRKQRYSSGFCNFLRVRGVEKAGHS